jgi:arginyl-tRNA synthetase
MTEPVLTWNLFVTAFFIPLCLLLLWGAIKRQFKERDKKEEKISALLTEKEEAREAAILEWKNSVSKTLCDIKLKLDILGGALYDKVNWEHCAAQEKEIRTTLDKHDERIRMAGK